MSITINGTTGIAGVDGSASTPAIQGNDTNTGMFFPAADTIAFAEGGAEVARFDSSGNLGIGTSSPGTRLDVSGNLRFSAVNPVIELNNGGAQIYSTVANTLQFASGGGIGSPTERARIDSSGNMLVGTTTNTNSSRIVSNGVIESTSGGVRFPDGTTQTTAAGALTTAAVLNATAGASLGAVGTYALLYNTTALSTIYLPGETAPGSVFYYTGANGSTQSNTIPSGTWRCLGFTNIANSAARSTLWLRIS